LNAPVTIIGDLHGQFYDLLAMLGDLKGLGDTQILFLGDYVDRGNFSIEILFLLLALKIQYPRSIFLLRGNHETRMMAEYMTFALECDHKYGSEVLYQEFTALFDSLPLCAILHSAGVGTFLAVHGGISPSISTLAEIQTIERFKEPETEGPLCDLLWSDPLDEPTPITNLQAWFETEYVENSPRQTSCFYGPSAITRFLKQNGLVGIIRGHQVVEGGFKEHYLQQFDAPPVITIFSCPNYCDMYRNKGALMILSDDGYEFEQFVESPHPFYLPDFSDPFSYGLPFLMENMVSVLADLVISIKEESADLLSPDERALDSVLTDKLVKLRYQVRMRERKHERLLKLKQSLLATTNSNPSIFEKIRAEDLENEQSPHKKRRATQQQSSKLTRTLSLTAIKL